MTNVFSIDFKYKMRTYPALVTVTKRGEDHSVSVQLQDSSLDHIVPEGELFFPLYNGLQRASQPTPKQQLIQSAREAVLQKIKTMTII